MTEQEQDRLFDVPEPESDFEPWQRRYSLYGGVPPHVGSDTSEAAARSMIPKLGEQQERIYLLIRGARGRGMTDDEIEQETGLRHQTASARRRELVLLGMVTSMGQRRTSSGRQANVWIVT
jgi:hypothetical protein